jgi:uncharacterized membrane protein HdeD (DUF308 family)
MNRGPATWATAIALALINLGLATLIVQAVSAEKFAPAWLGAVLLVGGLAAAVGAFVLWRQYLNEVRAR